MGDPNRPRLDRTVSPPMKLPNAVRVGYLVCPVRAMPVDESKERGEAGCFDRSTGVIEVADDLSPPLTADTLLHEMLHGMCLLGGLQLEEDVEERIVRVLTTQLLSAMRDNSALFYAFVQSVSQPIES